MVSCLARRRILEISVVRGAINFAYDERMVRV
jgi:hypothetical protein